MDSQREVCYLLLAAGAGREEGAINLSSDGFRPPICCCRYCREVWGRKCKTNPVRLSGLPTELGAPIYTDPLPPNVPSSEQKYRTDAALVCLHIPSVFRRTDGLGPTLGPGSRIRAETRPSLLGTFHYPNSVNPFRLSLFLRQAHARTPAAVGVLRHRFYKRVGFFSGGGTATHLSNNGSECMCASSSV